VYFGKGNDKIVAYDKSQQLRLTDQTRCRIEQQMTGKKVPTKHLLDLPAALCVGSFRALADVSMADIRLVDLGSIERKSDVHRHGELQSLLSIIGLQETKKILNKHGRFQRDYQKLLIEKPMAKPSELAFASLAKFFDLP
jgi:hypothetical protein